MKLQEQPGKDFKITVLQMLEEATGKQFNDIRKLTQEQNEFNKDKENIEKKKSKQYSDWTEFNRVLQNQTWPSRGKTGELKDRLIEII